MMKVFPKYIRICALRTPNDETNVLQQNEKTFFVIEAKIIRLLSDILDFTFTIDYPKDNHTGRILENGSWTGLIGMVYRKECDLAIDDIGVTEERRKAVSFTYPFYTVDVTFLTNMPEVLPKSLAIFYPFSVNVWIAIILVFFLISLLFYVQDYKNLSFQCTLLKMFGLLMNQSCIFKLKGRYSRILLISWMIGSMFLIFFYKATYLSFLSFPPKRGVRSIKDLSEAVEKGTHICMTYVGAYYIESLVESNDNAVKEIGESLKKNSITYMEPYEFFLTLSEKRGAFISNRHFLSPFQDAYFLSEDTFFLEMFGIAITETFCCKSTLDEIIRRIYETGFYDKFWREKNNKASFMQYYLKINTVKRPWLCMEDFIGAFACLIIGYVLSFIVLVTEIVLYNLTIRHNSKH